MPSIFATISPLVVPQLVHLDINFNIIHFTQTNTSRLFFFYHLPLLWNSLPHLNLLNLSLSQVVLSLKQLYWSQFTTHFGSSNSCNYHFRCPYNKCIISANHNFYIDLSSILGASVSYWSTISTDWCFVCCWLFSSLSCQCVLWSKKIRLFHFGRGIILCSWWWSLVWRTVSYTSLGEARRISTFLLYWTIKTYLLP